MAGRTAAASGQHEVAPGESQPFLEGPTAADLHYKERQNGPENVRIKKLVETYHDFKPISCIKGHKGIKGLKEVSHEEEALDLVSGTIKDSMDPTSDGAALAAPLGTSALNNHKVAMNSDNDVNQLEVDHFQSIEQRELANLSIDWRNLAHNCCVAAA